MAKIYKRNCDYCHKYYEGRGKNFCSGKCHWKMASEKPDNIELERRRKIGKIIRQAWINSPNMKNCGFKKGDKYWDNPKSIETRFKKGQKFLEERNQKIRDNAKINPNFGMKRSILASAPYT